MDTMSLCQLAWGRGRRFFLLLFWVGIGTQCSEHQNVNFSGGGDTAVFQIEIPMQIHRYAATTWTSYDPHGYPCIFAS